jgi:hypothetical protein
MESDARAELPSAWQSGFLVRLVVPSWGDICGNFERQKKEQKQKSASDQSYCQLLLRSNFDGMCKYDNFWINTFARPFLCKCTVDLNAETMCAFGPKCFVLCIACLAKFHRWIFLTQPKREIYKITVICLAKFYYWIFPSRSHKEQEALGITLVCHSFGNAKFIHVVLRLMQLKFNQREHKSKADSNCARGQTKLILTRTPQNKVNRV